MIGIIQVRRFSVYSRLMFASIAGVLYLPIDRFFKRRHSDAVYDFAEAFAFPIVFLEILNADIDYSDRLIL